MDGCEPPKVGEPVLIGLYNDTNLTEGVYATAQSFGDVVPAAGALIKEHGQ